jgi:regulator of extracellular matrix RemA (YlzA/DUF370 family)
VTSRLPPRPATWLLVRLGNSSRIDPLIGDLAEQFAEGRSRLWYWRQAAGALGLDLLRTLRTHAASFIAAVLTGCVLTSVWGFGISYVFHPLYTHLPEVTRHPWTAEALLRVAGMQLNGTLDCVLTFATVWLVTRAHQAHQRAVLLAFVVALTATRLPGIGRVVIDAATHSRMTINLVPVFVPTALQAAFTLVAGLWMIRTKCFAEVDRRTRVVAILMAAQAPIIALMYDARRVGAALAQMDRRTRCVAIFATVQAYLVALVYRARLAGALPLARPEWYALDLLDIASVAYLAYLLWRPTTTGLAGSAATPG